MDLGLVAMNVLRLDVRDFSDAGRWRWVLTGPGGDVRAYHDVRLDTACWQYEAFTGLEEYLRWHVAPDRRIADEARIVAEVGEWIGAHVLGQVGLAIASNSPTAVRVIMPPEAIRLAFMPLQLAHVGGRPVAVQGVTFVVQVGNGAADDKVPVAERLRVLGLFSLPAGGQALSLRRERQSLLRLFAGMASKGRAVDVRVLQYGVTRERLQNALADANGWDIIHISGHGAPGELLLETENGYPDPVPATDLAGLIETARARPKLVTVSACWSGAPTEAAQRRLLGLPVSLEQNDQDAVQRQDRPVAGALATELARRLDCAVLAMRYRVTDDFARALSETLYALLVRDGKPLSEALGMTLRNIVAIPATAACPALSAATPSLFGVRAVDLRLRTPDRHGREAADVGLARSNQPKLSGFPGQPERFVGRTAVMARSSAALAPHSGIPGVLLYGLPGGGKTACALELAYTHEHAFNTLIWFKASDEGTGAEDSIYNFASVLEQRLPDLKMIHLLAASERFTESLPMLTAALTTQRILVVIDNIESLLTSSGKWRDARWGQVVDAMTAHSGLGRLLLTSQRRLAGLGERILVEAVDALSLDEALLLSQELPHLGALIDGKLPGAKPQAARQLARHVLNLAQGHPKLLELAEGQAASPDRLAQLITSGDKAWRDAGGLPAAFFATGHTSASGQGCPDVLAAWTLSVTEGLGAGERELFWFLCCIQENHRIRMVLDIWPDLRRRLDQDEPPPGIDASLDVLSAQGLISFHPGRTLATSSYHVHPAVAAVARAEAGADFRKTADRTMAEFWVQAAWLAQEREREHRSSSVVVRSGLAAIPYQLRLGEWDEANAMLHEVIDRDDSRATAAAALPVAQTILGNRAGTGEEPAAAYLLARVTEPFDRAAAERQMRQALSAALTHADYGTALAATHVLVRYCITQGQLDQALKFAEDRIDHAKRSGQGPFTQLAAEGTRLTVLTRMGDDERVLAEVHRLLGRMDSLTESDYARYAFGGDKTFTQITELMAQARAGEPERALEGLRQVQDGARERAAASVQPDQVPPWSVRETLLQAGFYAASHLERSDEALTMIDETISSMQARGAPETELARCWTLSCQALIDLGELDKAAGRLQEARTVAERARDAELIGYVLCLFADTEHARGHDRAAVRLAEDGLRYLYLSGGAWNVSLGHERLGDFLHESGRPDAAMTHHLAAALIRAMITGTVEEESVLKVVTDLRASGDLAGMPTDVGELCRRAAGKPDIQLRLLLDELAPATETLEQALRELTNLARGLADK